MWINTRNFQRSVSTGDQTFVTLRGSSILFCLSVFGLYREISIRLYLIDGYLCAKVMFLIEQSKYNRQKIISQVFWPKI